MILEYAQLLSTAHRILDGKESKQLSKNGKVMVSYWTLPDHRENLLYRAAYYNHPCSKWVQASKDHYIWLLELWNHLNREYTNRYNKVHKSYRKLVQHLNQLPNNIDNAGFKMPPQCMPDDCKIKNNTVEAYQKYYKAHKREFATWKNSIPLWFN